ncbi:MAG: SH3-like domain-containing protein [Gibbsiella quercinecans]|uniref:Nitrile hydratase beta subunit domain-containing protein n=1 Tax=Gibbsiella dentisursi TaxID=796890 RepID=A0ABP7KMQ1_9GAMM|nr:SH3-like domain-containing protein [Gibbsiella quercinecans]
MMKILEKDQVYGAVKTNPVYVRPTDRPVRFAAGDKVQAKNINPLGHTRLPRYVRGRIGTVVRHQGSFVFPDTYAHGKGENPQHVYSVRFEAQALWGEETQSKDAVYLDLWDDYIEPANGAKGE